MKLKEYKKDPKFAGMTKKKIKKALKSDNIVPDDKKKYTDVKKKKQNKKLHSKTFTKSLKKNLITDGLAADTDDSQVPDHGQVDTRNLNQNSRYVFSRMDVFRKINQAPTVIIDMDFAQFKNKNV